MVNFLSVVLQLEKLPKSLAVHPKKSGRVKVAIFELKKIRNDGHKFREKYISQPLIKYEEILFGEFIFKN